MADFRGKMHDLLDQGAIDGNTLAKELLNFMSDDVCREFMESNGYEEYVEEVENERNPPIEDDSEEEEEV